ncbi:hypothetical protein YC2023_100410 [Brassica napus]
MASAIKANPLIGWRPEFSHREVNPFDIPQSSNSSSSISGSTGARGLVKNVVVIMLI